MKMKKKSTAVIICAAILVAGVSAVFATSPKPVETKNMEDLPPAVMTDQTANPAPAPAPMEQDVPQNAPSAPDASAAPQTASVTPEQGAEPVQQPVDSNVEPVVASGADTTEPDTPPVSAPPVFSFDPDDPVEFWGIPEGPIAAGTVLNAHNEEEFREMIQQLRMMGYAGTFNLISYLDDGRCAVILGEDYDGVTRSVEAPEGFMPDWTYPVNSKGETYGTAFDRKLVGYDPDLIAVVATNGVSGYAFKRDVSYGGYQGKTETLDDIQAYMEWREAQSGPRMIPVYDVNRDNIVGYFKLSDGRDSMTQDEELAMIEQQMRNNMGLSEEEISNELEAYKQSRGWN